MNTVPKGKMDSTSEESSSRNRSELLLGQLPDNFLRIDNMDHQIENDQELAASLQKQYDQQAAASGNQWATQFKAQLVLTFVEARLVKNYGLMNMNPYLRLRVGHTIYETKTSNKSGKNPRWNETFKCYLPHGVESLSIEILNECLITADDLIAWATFTIPVNYLKDLTRENTFEETILLNGKQGDLKEGDLSFVCTVKPITASTMVENRMIANPMYQAAPPYVLAGTSLLTQPIIVHQSTVPVTQLTPANNVIQIQESDIKSLHEMFPKIEIDVIKSVLYSERGNVDRAINNLLELNSTTTD